MVAACPTVRSYVGVRGRRPLALARRAGPGRRAAGEDLAAPRRRTRPGLRGRHRAEAPRQTPDQALAATTVADPGHRGVGVPAQGRQGPRLKPSPDRALKAHAAGTSEVLEGDRPARLLRARARPAPPRSSGPPERARAATPLVDAAGAGQSGALAGCSPRCRLRSPSTSPLGAAPEAPRVDTSEIDALQTDPGRPSTRRVHVYGVLGARTSQAAEPDLYAALRAAYEAHRERRDQLTRRDRGDGATPEPVAAAAYALPTRLDTRRRVDRGGAGAEERACARPTPPWWRRRPVRARRAR